MLVLLLALALLPATALAYDPAEYAWTISPESLTFTVAEGYEGAPAQEITAVSTGAKELDFIMAGGAAATHEMLHISVGGMTAAVWPKPGLPVGVHTATVVISQIDDLVPETEIPVTVIVTAGPSPYPTLAELKIIASPAKLSYTEGESFDSDGVELAAVYSDGSEKDVTNEGLVMQVHDPLTLADAEVTFVYTDENNYTREARLPITVDADPNHPAAVFADVAVAAWYRPYVGYVVQNGLMQGVAADKFAPDASLTRAMVVTILHRLAGRPEASADSPFSDVAPGDWYSQAVAWANANGIVEGYGEGRFGPADSITREQLAAILYRYIKLDGEGYGQEPWAFKMPFRDEDTVSEWAYEPMCWWWTRGVILGKSEDLLDPHGQATRAEAAAIFMRFLAWQE